MVVDTELQDWGEGWSWKSNSSASGWRNGTAELVMLAAGKALGRIYWPAGGGGGGGQPWLSQSPLKAVLGDSTGEDVPSWTCFLATGRLTADFSSWIKMLSRTCFFYNDA